MLHTIRKYLADHFWGDYASVLGVAITVVGFAVIIINVRRSKRVMDGVRRDMRRVDTVSELERTLSTMDEIKRLHRENDWKLLLDRYGILKKHLIAIRTVNPSLSGEHKTVIQGAIQRVSGMQDVAEGCVQGKDPPNVRRLNAVVSDQMDALYKVLMELKDTVGR